MEHKVYTIEELERLKGIFSEATELWAGATKNWLYIHGEEWFPVRNMGFKVKIKYKRDKKIYNCTIVGPTGTPDSRALLETHKPIFEFLKNNQIDCFFDKGR